MKKWETIMQKLNENIDAFHRLALKAKLEGDDKVGNEMICCMSALTMFRNQIEDELGLKE